MCEAARSLAKARHPRFAKSDDDVSFQRDVRETRI